MQTLRKLRDLAIQAPKDESRAAALLVTLVLSAWFEALGIGLVLPFIALVQAPALAAVNPKVQQLAAALHVHSHQQMVWIFAGILTLVFVLKNAYLFVVTQWQIRFVVRAQVAVSRRLMEAHLCGPYALHLQQSSAEIIRKISNDVPTAYARGVLSAVVLVVEGITAAVIFGMLVVIQPIIVPAVGGLFLVVGLVFHRLMQQRNATFARQTMKTYADMLRWLQHGVGAAKEARVAGCEGYFLDGFRESMMAFGQTAGTQRWFASLPRPVLETLSVGALGMFSAAFLATGPRAEVLPVLGLLAVATVRLMPTGTRLISALTDLQFARPFVDSVHADLERGRALASRASRGPKLPFDREIRLVDVDFTYPGASAPALQGVSFTVPRGESVALVGPSGGGKSTCIDLIVGLLDPNRGRVEVDGTPLSPENLPSWQARIGYIPQHVFLTDDTIGRNVAFGVPDEQIDEGRVRDAIAAAQLSELVQSTPHGLDTMVGELGNRLSGGERQRIGIARALVRAPDLLILDEATASIDGVQEREIARAVDVLKERRTIILIAHRLSTVRSCDRLVYIDGGKVVASGSWDELVETCDDFRRMVSVSGMTSERPSCQTMGATAKA